MHPIFVPIPIDDGCVFLGPATAQHFPNPQWPKVWGCTETWIVHIHRHVRLYHPKSMSQYCFSLPDDFEPLCVYFWSGFLFIGGKGGGDKILAYSLSKHELMPVEHPNILRKYRKSIDGFFPWNDMLYAIDNTVHPKYLLGFAYEKERFVLKAQVKIPSHTPEERIVGGVLLHEELVLLSRSAHRAGMTTYINFYRDLRPHHSLCWHKTIGNSVEITHIRKMRVFQDSLVLVTDKGVAILKSGDSEEDVVIRNPQRHLIDVYPQKDGPWIAIQEMFFKRKKILLS